MTALSRPPRRSRLRSVRAIVCLATVLAVAAGATAVVQVATAAASAPARAAAVPGAPIGRLDAMSLTPGGLLARGWSLDPDAPATTNAVYAWVDGKNIKSGVPANLNRPDVATAHPGAGPLHGFSWSIPVPEGRHTVCIRATNLGPGAAATLQCRTATFNYGPVGALDVPKVTAGKVRIRGWAFDRDAVTTPLSVVLRIDSTSITVTADRTRSEVAKQYPGVGSSHGFDITVTLPQGRHTICAVADNLGYGSDRSLGCRTVVVNFIPKASLAKPAVTSTGLSLTGWAYDPDTSKPVTTNILLDGRQIASITANRKGRTYSGHNFKLAVRARSGRHTVCAVAVNLLYGTRNSTPACRTVTLALKPLGAFQSLTRAAGSNGLVLTGWALDPDTFAPISVAVTIDKRRAPTLTAGSSRPDIGARYPGLGSAHGLSTVLAADDGEHTVCLTAVNVSGGKNVSLGCRIVWAVHPVTPSNPQTATAIPGFGGATVTWAAPASDGGAPIASYVVTSSPANVSVSVPGTSTTGVVVGLKASTYYTFTVRAVNGAGLSSGTTMSSAVRTEAGPPAQRSPAPISTSRYIRNVRGSSPAELATMRAEGATDAAHNPSGHGYLVLLDIGGQDAYDKGVVLSATTRFVTYGDLVRDVQAYLDGYAGAQRSSAPVMIAIGTNNDMDVSAATGRAWATSVVNPLAAYATRYVGMSIAGANDIEPGFRASYSTTKSWLGGYLSATSAAFIFNGSADGCAWTVTNRRCNNGWTMAGLHYLAAAAAPTRMLNLPQIYNNTMADQWKFISLTGVVNGLPRINFAGVLTEYTACSQTRSCGSMSGRSAWTRLWNNLQSDARLKVSSLPYATDLRIDR
ncbi:fibronectin type III domain-containing protein [uncultured Jatrophihabitans sp.]|uniref:fibronectin type III domain-containing protein n=1 Tax=uncultured Jatrophihabitans sp. TaxID=1610747 RepID=UPI0035CB74A7